MPLIPLKIPKINTGNIRRRLFEAMDATGRQHIAQLERTTANFDNVKPEFVSQVVESDGDLSVTTAPLDDEWGVIWSYLDQGTDVRYAWMTPDFQSKSVPGTFSTRQGSGGFRNLNLTNPAPGIEARGWTELLVKEDADKFTGRIQSAINDVARRLFEK